MRSSGSERGAVMVWALIFVILTSGMVISHSAYMASHRRTMDVQLKRKPLAATYARAALTDGLTWFQAQPSQPVADFAPRQDLSVNPPVLDTIDPGVGLVREFEIRGNLWGRYEIRKEEATDVSKMYGSSTPGSVWRLAARGYVYRIVDASKRFDEAPNTVVSSSRVETTVRSVPLNLPAAAAIDIDDLSRLTIGPGGKVHGGASHPGVAGPPLSGLLSGVLSLLSSLVTGSPRVLTVPGYKSEPVDVFRMSLPELRDLADVVVSSTSVRWLADEIPDDAIVFHQGNLTITPARQLRGSMLLIVNGSLIVQAGSQTEIEGLVYVTGNTELRGPFRLTGVLVGKGTVLVQGNGAGQDAIVQYDDDAVQRIVQSLSRYRASRTARTIDDRPRGTAPTSSTGAGSTIHPTATIERGVVMGDNINVGREVKVEEHVQIGSDSTLLTKATVKKRALLGTGVQVGAHAVVEDFAVIGDGVVLGDYVKVGVGARIAPGTVVPANTEIRSGVNYP